MGYANLIYQATRTDMRGNDGIARIGLVRGFFSQRLSECLWPHVHRRAGRERERVRGASARAQGRRASARFVLWPGASFGAIGEARIASDGARSESSISRTRTTGGRNGQS